MINRDKYLNLLVNKINNGYIKVITGLRRIGKSYLLDKIFKNYLVDKMNIDKNNILYISFDEYKNEHLLKRDNLYNYLINYIEQSNNKKIFLLLDEIQNVEHFESILLELNKRENLDIYVTGSNSKFLSKDILTSFRGRDDQIKMHPLSFKEFYSYKLNLLKTETNNSTNPENIETYFDFNDKVLNEYMSFGGIIETVLKKDYLEKRKILNYLIDSIYVKDILERYSLKREPLIKDLLKVLSSNIGSYTNTLKLTNTYKSINNNKVSLNRLTTDNYLNIFVDSFLIEKVNRYDIKGKKYLESFYKYYFTDLGIRNELVHFNQENEPTHLMENLIYNELIYQDYQVDIGIVEVYKMDINTNKNHTQKKLLEIDFKVKDKNNKTYYIQSAYSLPNKEKIDQEKESLIRSNDFHKKIIIIKDKKGYSYDDKNIIYLGLIDFLLDPSIIEKI